MISAGITCVHKRKDIVAPRHCAKRGRPGGGAGAGPPPPAAAPQYRARQTADGKPNLSGIWQAMNTAEWDIQAHDAKAGPLVVMGAVGAIPAGFGVVEDGRLPYRPEGLAKRREN